MYNRVICYSCIFDVVYTLCRLYGNNEFDSFDPLALPVSSRWNFLEGRRWALRQVLPAPVDQELFGRLSGPAATRVVEVAHVLRLILRPFS